MIGVDIKDLIIIILMMRDKILFRLLIVFLLVVSCFLISHYLQLFTIKRPSVNVSTETAAVQGFTSNLIPGQVLTYEFPKLPKTLAGNTPIITLRLPDHYTTQKTYPLFIFLYGGEGGKGDRIDTPLAVVGKEDYIIGNFPLFGQKNVSEPHDGILVSFDNYSDISLAIQEFMTKIDETIPNINSEKSVMGGSSNGAHTIALLLSALNPRVLESFHNFFFIDGGEDWTWASLSRTSKLKNHRFLLVYGGGKLGRAEWWRKHTLNRGRSYHEFAKKWDIDLEYKVVSGFNHGFHEAYYPIIRRWLKQS